MSAKTRALYSAHLTDQGKRPLEYWPKATRPGAVQKDMTKAQTVRPPAPEVTPQSLRTLAAEMRADASRWLARANDLEAAAKRLEGE
jgi:hypothetical protein